MNKKLMAVAVAGALAAPAAALAQSTVQMYGNIYMEYAFTSTGARRYRHRAIPPTLTSCKRRVRPSASRVKRSWAAAWVPGSSANPPLTSAV